MASAVVMVLMAAAVLPKPAPPKPNCGIVIALPKGWRASAPVVTEDGKCSFGVSPRGWSRERAQIAEENDIAVAEVAVSIEVVKGTLDLIAAREGFSREASGWTLEGNPAHEFRTSCCVAVAGTAMVRMYGREGGYRGMRESPAAVVAGRERAAALSAEFGLDRTHIFEQLVRSVRLR